MTQCINPCPRIDYLITARTSPSDCLVSYLGHSLGGSYPSAEVQSVYSTAPADWVIEKSEYLGDIRYLLSVK